MDSSFTCLGFSGWSAMQTAQLSTDGNGRRGRGTFPVFSDIVRETASGVYPDPLDFKRGRVWTSLQYDSNANIPNPQALKCSGWMTVGGKFKPE